MSRALAKAVVPPCRCDDPRFSIETAEGNTGFFFMRSNERTRRIYSEVLEMFASTGKELDDQTLFWDFLRQEHAQSRILSHNGCHDLEDSVSANASLKLVTCSLNPCIFSVGATRAPDFFLSVLFGLSRMTPPETIGTMVRSVPYLSSARPLNSMSAA